jgi:hypothetical protein
LGRLPRVSTLAAILPTVLRAFTPFQSCSLAKIKTFTKLKIKQEKIALISSEQKIKKKILLTEKACRAPTL